MNRGKLQSGSCNGHSFYEIYSRPQRDCSRRGRNELDTCNFLLLSRDGFTIMGFFSFKGYAILERFEEVGFVTMETIGEGNDKLTFVVYV